MSLIVWHNINFENTLILFIELYRHALNKHVREDTYTRTHTNVFIIYIQINTVYRLLNIDYSWNLKSDEAGTISVYSHNREYLGSLSLQTMMLPGGEQTQRDLNGDRSQLFSVVKVDWLPQVRFVSRFFSLITIHCAGWGIATRFGFSNSF